MLDSDPFGSRWELVSQYFQIVQEGGGRERDRDRVRYKEIDRGREGR